MLEFLAFILSKTMMPFSRRFSTSTLIMRVFMLVETKFYRTRVRFGAVKSLQWKVSS